MLTCSGDSLGFDVGDALGIILLLRISSSLGGILTWGNIIYDLAFSHGSVHET